MSIRAAQAQHWLALHPRFVCHFLPTHCECQNQIEQWFSIVQRKRLQISDFPNLDHLAERLMAFVTEWNARAHPDPLVHQVCGSRDGQVRGIYSTDRCGLIPTLSAQTGRVLEKYLTP